MNPQWWLDVLGAHQNILHGHYMSQDKRHQPQKSDDKHTMNDMQITDLPAKELLTHAHIPKNCWSKSKEKPWLNANFSWLKLFFAVFRTSKPLLQLVDVFFGEYTIIYMLEVIKIHELGIPIIPIKQTWFLGVSKSFEFYKNYIIIYLVKSRHHYPQRSS